MNVWRVRGGVLSLDTPQVMGILNVTPDSFSDGGQYVDPAVAATHAKKMVLSGATVVDIGAQSTRPGAVPLSAAEEWARLQPCLAAVAEQVSVPLSVDTFHPEVAEKALRAGAHIINDVSGGEHNNMAAVAAAYGAGLVCMRPGDPASRTAAAHEVVANTIAYFRRAMEMTAAAGVSPQAVCLDVGIGFGSSTEGDLTLVASLPQILAEFRDVAVMVGASRKRVVADVCGGIPPAARLPGSLALHTVALWNGAHIVRAHDVAETVAAAKMVAALQKARNI